MASTRPKISDEAVKRATGKGWVTWFRLLDRADARKLAHPAIAKLLAKKFRVSDWWSQMVTVQYEYSRKLRSTRIVVPKALKAALSKNAKAAAAFAAMPPSHKKEYVTWIAEAKRPETQNRRIQRSMKMMVAWYAKRRNR